MNIREHNYDNKAISHPFDEICTGYISYQTLLEFIDADESATESKLKWLELNLIAIERYIKKGEQFEIQSEINTIIIMTKNDFYQWCKHRLKYAYVLFLRNRHY